MRVLVTGVNGFAGGHLAAELLRAGHDIIGMDIAPTPAVPDITYLSCDIRDDDDVRASVAAARPEAAVHLAGAAFVPAGESDPPAMFAVNVMGSVHVMEALRREAPACRLLLISTSQVYGPRRSDAPVDEDAPMHPPTVYAVTKMCADRTALYYAEQYGLPYMTARPNNHMGPGQSPRFVSSAFADQAARIKQHGGVLRVGNLDSERDFLDVRDVVRAYRLLLEKGHPGRAYNIASGRLRPIRALLEEICRAAGIRPNAEIDPERFRPTDYAPLLSTERLRKDTGWAPEIDLEETVRDLYRHMETVHRG